MSRFLTRATPVLALALAVLAFSAPLQAQGWRDKLKKKVQNAEGAVDRAVGNDSKSNPVQAVASAASAGFDFVAGSDVLFSDDFTRDRVDDIPSRVKIASGNWEVADYQGRRFLRTTSAGEVMIPLGSTLPQKFTVEFDVIQNAGHSTFVYFVPESQRQSHQEVEFGTKGGIGDFKSDAGSPTEGVLFHARLMVDGAHAKVYINDKRVANVPEANLGRSNAIWVWGQGSDDNPYYITNIRVAGSQRSLFDALNASGRIVTHGILFATGSDRIEPQSEATLNDIGQMLKAHPDLKLTIEGHTDNVGQSAANLALSQKRAAAVEKWLEEHYPIEHDRLIPKGFGDTKPVASNATDAGRQENRRVELVKN